MDTEAQRLALHLFDEARKEILQSQKLRAYATGAKIAFTSSLLAALIPRLEDQPYLLAIPAVAAVFFDLIVNSYSFAIKRVGSYCRHHLEPLLFGRIDWPQRFETWERFMLMPAVKQRLAMFGQLGFTGMVIVAAAAAACVCQESRSYAAWIVAGLAALFLIDVLSFRRPGQLERALDRASRQADSKA